MPNCRLAEEPLPLMRALSGLGPRERALKAGSSRSSSLGDGEAGGTSAPSLPRAEASVAEGQGWGVHRRPVRSGLAPWPASPLETHQCINHTVQVIEEGEQVEGEFAPGLLLAVVEDVSIHDGDCIIHDLRAIRRTVEVPPEVVEEEGDVEPQGHPLCCT